MNLCRYQIASAPPRVGLITADGQAWDLTALGVESLTGLLEHEQLVARIEELLRQQPPVVSLATARLLAPIERQEVWAAGVTYLRSKTARMEESDFSATAYDRVYAAERPELFFKSLPEKVAGPWESVGIRKDARWSVPEHELAIVINSRGRIAGYTIGNDMSSRDIEGENLLYLPQAKIYEHSCALGPSIAVGASEAEARAWPIQLAILRQGQAVFTGATSVGQIKRGFDELVAYLWRSQTFPHGAIMLTGTGIVPPDTFTLLPGDRVRINIPAIGLLENPVLAV